MTTLIFNHDKNLLPNETSDIIPVLLYGLEADNRIGHPIIEKIERLGVKVSEISMDFLSIALAVTAADTFVQRETAEDAWSRKFTIKLPLANPSVWLEVKQDLERALHFLSGDMWSFEFLSNGFSSPEPYDEQSRFKVLSLSELDCVCLFSGGLDSTIGAIDLLQKKKKPLLVSHGYKGDAKLQHEIFDKLKGIRSHFLLNADPHCKGSTDISMRTRSFNFLAFAVIGADVLKSITKRESIDIYIPENGFISINTPLTRRRIGSLSTRTTHPYFINSLQLIFNKLNMPFKLINPYQFKTKGEMVDECSNKRLLKKMVNTTVSCSHWKRKNQQCGICVPCLIRRSSLLKGKINERKNYIFNDITKINDNTKQDDLIALLIANKRKSEENIAKWILQSGSLPSECIKDFERVFISGLSEVEVFLRSEGVI